MSFTFEDLYNKIADKTRGELYPKWGVYGLKNSFGSSAQPLSGQRIVREYIKNDTLREALLIVAPYGAPFSCKCLNTAKYAWLGSPELKRGEGLAFFPFIQTTADQERLDATFRPAMVVSGVFCF